MTVAVYAAAMTVEVGVSTAAVGDRNEPGFVVTGVCAVPGVVQSVFA